MKKLFEDDPQHFEWTTQQCFQSGPNIFKGLIHNLKQLLNQSEGVHILQEMFGYLPSVSLLQKTPSSPVSCHATGFYPDSATLIWRKDGEEIHEDVDHGEILPNNDGSFQMSVDLKLSSVTPEDWRRYDCVFQLYGGKNDIVTKLDKAVIRTNEGFDPTIIIIAAVVVLALVLIAVVGFVIYKKKNDKRPPSPISNPEVMEELNPKA